MSDLQMPFVPVDDDALDAIEHALAGHLTYEAEDGSELEEPRRVGADYSLAQLLDFWAGVDPDNETLIGHSTLFGGEPIPIYEAHDVTLTPNDLIAALIAEVRRSRITQAVTVEAVGPEIPHADIGQDVSVIFDGVLIRSDRDAGVLTLRGNTRGAQHILWEVGFHWATTLFEPRAAAGESA